MSTSVTLSIGTNTAIAAAKGFGWFVTGSPTLFAETIHSLADVANQILLRTGEVRGKAPADSEHPFGHGQEKYFWALVSAVSVFFVGCGLNVYHGVHALIQRMPVEPFTTLVLGLLLFAFALESLTLGIALREIGGWKGLVANRHNTTVLAVVLEDAVALLGLVLTLVVAGVSFAWGPHPAFDAAVAIAVGVLLGAMALFLASINRRLLIDISDVDLDHAARRFLSEQGANAEVSSVVVDDDHAVVFLRTLPGSTRPFDTSDSYALGEALKAQLQAGDGKTIDEVYWKFPLVVAPGSPAERTMSLAMQQAILDFWFGAPESAAYGTPRVAWFRKDAAFDDEIRLRFGAVLETALAGGIADWISPRAMLARVLVLDQFTRNCYRGSARAFAGDPLALAAATAAVDQGRDHELNPVERWFLYMPFEHSESAAAQARSLALFTQLRDETGLADPLIWAEKHAAVIRRFGRYPHRNALLGRESTAEEIAFLTEHGSNF